MRYPHSAKEDFAEFLELPYNDEGHTIKSVFAQATFYPSGGEKDVVEATQ